MVTGDVSVSQIRGDGGEGSRKGKARRLGWVTDAGGPAQAPGQTKATINIANTICPAKCLTAATGGGPF